MKLTYADKLLSSFAFKVNLHHYSKVAKTRVEGIRAENKAAVRIQSAERAKLARRRVDAIRAENEAAVKIQSAQRVKLAKQRVEHMRVERAGALAVRDHTAPAATRRVAESRTSRETEARDIFAELDRNGDGAVNIREVILVLRSSAAVAQRLALPQRVRQEGGTRDALEAFFREYDTDGDRSLTLEEFVAHFGGGAEPRPSG